MKKNTADITYQHIKQRIVSGEYSPSQHLVEIKLSQELGVSRHNIRIALNRLKAEGLVRIEPNRGAIVASLSLEDIADILAAREALEGAVARIAAEHITSAQIRRLEECLVKMRELLANAEYDSYSSANKTFHKIIHAASKTRTIPELIDQLRARMARVPLRTLIVPGRGERSYAEHAAILTALRSKNPEAAESTAKAHINSLKEIIRKSWSLIRI
ncbi:MAG: GntR family transcriptional regulator [Thermodesulfobacteriota bacterium]